MSHVYEKYVKYRVKNVKPQYISRKEFKEGPPVVLSNKIKLKPSKLTIEIPNILINRRLRPSVNKEYRSPTPVNTREMEIEDLIINRKPINLPAISNNHSPKSVRDSFNSYLSQTAKINDSIRSSRTEDLQIPD